MSFMAGMRVGEIAALKIGDVMNADGSIKDQINLKPDQTKGSRGRTVIVGDKLKGELAIYTATLKHCDSERPLFSSQRSSNGFSPNTLCKRFAHLYEQADVQGGSSHSGRRTFITTLANKGVGVRVLMSLAGHQNMSTTQRYIDLNDEMLKVAVNLI